MKMTPYVARQFAAKSYEQLPELLTPEEAAVWFRMDVQQVRRLCRNGNIKAVKLGKLWRIDKSSIKQEIAS